MNGTNECFWQTGHFWGSNILRALELFAQVTAGCTVFFIEYNILNNSLFEFREGHSTTLVLSEFVEGVLSTFDNGESVCAVLLDLIKAFDCVDREILLKNQNAVV